MFIPIEINSNDILSQYKILSKEIDNVIDTVVKDITAAFAAEWEETAKTDLKSTRNRYLQNLRVVDEGRMSGAVILDYTKDSLVKMIEEGSSPFDMKVGFSNSSKRKVVERADGSSGWYLTIPFSLGTPSSNIESGFSSILPESVYNVAKSQPIVNNNKSQGLRKDDLPSEFQEPATRAAITIPESQSFLEYKHKASIYQGVVKQKDSVTGQSSYYSFRRVSDNSDENSWGFPGLESKNLAEKAYSSFKSKLPKLISDTLERVLFNNWGYK